MSSNSPRHPSRLTEYNSSNTHYPRELTEKDGMLYLAGSDGSTSNALFGNTMIQAGGTNIGNVNPLSNGTINIPAANYSNYGVVKLSNSTPVAPTTSSGTYGTSSYAARADHRHPIGNANRATYANQFNSSVYINLSGDVTGSNSSARTWNIPTTLATVNSNPGWYGNNVDTNVTEDDGFTVENPFTDGSTSNSSNMYGFTENSSLTWSTNTIWESNNKGVQSSIALCKVIFTGPNPKHVTISSISSGESSYDYGIISNLDCMFTYSSNSITEDSNVLVSYKSSPLTTSRDVVLEVPSGTHYVYIAFRKDGSADNGNDSMQFAVSYTLEDMNLTIPCINVDKKGRVISGQSVVVPRAASSCYATCSTSASTVAKVVTHNKFNLKDGECITIKFTNAHTASTMTLNVNNTGAITVYDADTNTNPATNIIRAGDVATFMYDSTNSRYYIISRANHTALYTASVSTSGWTSGSGYVYKSISVSGIMTNDNPIVDMASSSTASTAASYLETFNKIYYISTYNGGIYVYMTEAPSTTITLRLLVNY